MIFAGAKICGAKICGAKMIFVFFCRSFHHRPGAKIFGAMIPPEDRPKKIDLSNQFALIFTKINT